MPAKWFICPDNERIEISQCLSKHGCRMPKRCATLAYLRLISAERNYRGITPSMAGNGPRLIYLKEVTDYAINPNSRAFAALGVAVHGRLSVHALTDNILAEEPLSDEQASGTPDCIEENEFGNGYVLTDYKTFGSYKVARAIGIYKETVTLTDKDGTPLKYKTGKKAGQEKTRQEIRYDPKKADLRSEALQQNRYRIFLEASGFPIGRMQLQAIVRDGGTKNASMNGIARNIVLIDIPRIKDDDVLEFYLILNHEVSHAFKTGKVRLCDDWESWNGRRCKGFCEVREACKAMEASK